MTRRIVEVVESNLSSEPADDEIYFTVDGNHYHLDCTAAEKKQFLETLHPYISVADTRRARTRVRRPGTVAEVRAWALQQGLSLSPKGRIPNEVWQQFAAAQGGAKKKR